MKEYVIELPEKGRRYMFRPLKGGKRVKVLRWEYLCCVSETVMPVDKARWLYRQMTRYIGYKPQGTKS